MEKWDEERNKNKLFHLISSIPPHSFSPHIAPLILHLPCLITFYLISNFTSYTVPSLSVFLSVCLSLSLRHPNYLKLAPTLLNLSSFFNLIVFSYSISLSLILFSPFTPFSALHFFPFFSLTFYPFFSFSFCLALFSSLSSYPVRFHLSLCNTFLFFSSFSLYRCGTRRKLSPWRGKWGQPVMRVWRTLSSINQTRTCSWVSERLPFIHFMKLIH